MSEPQTSRVTQGEDGKYRWVYEMNLLKNPTVFLLVWKILFCLIAASFVLNVLTQSGSDRFWWEGFLTALKMYGLVTLGMTVLAGVSYLIYAAIMGGKYIVEFEMDEHGVNHCQTASQAKKAKKLGRAAMLGGAAAGSFGAVSAGMSASRTEMYTDFAKVKKVKAYPKRCVIKLAETLEHNQVYALPEDFDFVRDYIVSHCPNLKHKA